VAVTVLLLAVHGAENKRNVRPKSTGEVDNRDGRRGQTLMSNEDEWAGSGDDLLPDEVDREEEEPIEGEDPFEEEEEEGSAGFEDEDENGEHDEGEDDDGFEDYDGSTDDTAPEDVPPTTTRSPTMLTKCQRQRNAKQTSNFESYRPQCTETGAFVPMQCYDVTEECWCVDSKGNQIGEQYRAPKMPACHPESGAPRPDGRQSTLRSDLEDFTIIESATGSNYNMKPPKNERKQEEPDIEPLPSKNWFDYLLHNPLILAAAIGGSVLLLVIIILMLMFCIYRMRKKDEGSYSLDEPRQTFNYTRAKDQEFFA